MRTYIEDLLACKVIKKKARLTSRRTSMRGDKEVYNKESHQDDYVSNRGVYGMQTAGRVQSASEKKNRHKNNRSLETNRAPMTKRIGRL